MTIDIDSYLTRVAHNFDALRSSRSDIENAIQLCLMSFQKGCKVMFCGNGGSAADSQHLAAELMGKFLLDRDPLPAIALTVDTSAITAIGNDYGYDDVFERQLRGLGQTGDALIGLSTSGRSKNVVKAFEAASKIGIKTIALTGSTSSPLSELADVAIKVPSSKTSHIQEMHIAIGHLICGIVEEQLCLNRR
jgi:D-sedoheptulose 7-phosphate isomerase